MTPNAFLGFEGPEECDDAYERRLGEAGEHERESRVVLVVDCRPMAREWIVQGMRSETDLACCGAWGHYADLPALELALDRHEPDAVVVGIIPEGVGLSDVIGAIRRRATRPAVLYFCGTPEESEAMAALRAGARGYVRRCATKGVFLAALRHVLAGGVFMGDQVALPIVARLFAQETNGDPVLQELSERELEIFNHVGNGFSPSEIALKIRLSVKTVENYRSRIMVKLNIASARKLSQFAIEWLRSRPG